jgi:hypothetical protein
MLPTSASALRPAARAMSLISRRRHQSERLVARPRKQRIPDPDGVEAKPLRPRREIEQGFRRRLARHDLLARGQQISEAGRHGGLR